MPTGRPLQLTRTAVDAKLMERSGLDEVNLRRVRRVFRQRWNETAQSEKRALAEGPVRDRYRFITDLLQETWTPACWALWLRYVEHSQEDIEEMRQGEYPISPYLIRLFSALLAIKVDFLLAGFWPVSDEVGPNIDAYPATGVRA